MKIDSRPSGSFGDEGLVTVLFLTILPLAIALLVIIGSSGSALVFYHRAQQRCRVELLKIQGDVANQLSQLVRLNPRAFQLRIEEQMARRALAAASGNAVAYAAALANYQRVIAQQIGLAKIQRAYWSSAKLGLVRGRTSLHQAMQQEARWFERFESGSVYREVISIAISGGILPIYQAPLASLTPDYRLGPSFAFLQALIVRWKIDLARVIPGWMRPYLIGITDLNGECSATIQAKDERSERWSVTLGTGRFSLNSY